MLYERGPETLIVELLSPAAGAQPFALCLSGARRVISNPAATCSLQVKRSFKESVDIANPSPKTGATRNQADETMASFADSTSQSELEKSPRALYHSPIFFKQKHPHPTQVVVG